MSLIEEQRGLLVELENHWTNFKKDGKDRKSRADYYKNQRNKVEAVWKNIQFNHDRLLMELSPIDPYFTERCFETAKATYQLYVSTIHTGSLEQYASTSGTVSLKAGLLETTGDEPQQQTQKADESRNLLLSSSYKHQGNYSKLDDILRQQEANFRAFARTISNMDINNLTVKWEFEDALKTLENRWSVIDKLHIQIDSELNGENEVYESNFSEHEKQFYTLKREINKKMWSVSYREKSTPTLEIPIFSGNYNNWMSFKDLFIDAVHNNTMMPNSQKMQILKTKVKGEAERLIQHLYISSDNYTSCWEILNNRYNNKKLIFTSHMNILFGLPNIQHNSITLIKRMHDVTLETLNAIKNLGVDTQTWDPILVHLLSQKLDPETYNNYLESVKNPRDLPVLSELLNYLESRFTNLETSTRRKQEFTPQKHYQNPVNIKKFVSYAKPVSNNLSKNTSNYPIAKSYNVTGSGYKCPLCKYQHGLYNCKTFLQLPNDKKLMTVKKLGLCLNCLFSHNGKDCNSAHTCRNCTEHHNTLLHEACVNSASKPSTSYSTVATSSNKNVTNVSRVSEEDCPEILLATAQLRVKGADGTFHNMRALVDQGSQISLITEQAAQILGIKRENYKALIYGVGQRENNCKGKIKVTCASLYNDYNFTAEVIIMTNLVKRLPNKTFNKPTWPTIRNINLADPEFYISRPVDLLLGADIYSQIILSGIIKGEESTQPVAQQTQLGWLLCGTAQTFHCNVIVTNMEDIQQFWEVEEITEDGQMSSEDLQCVKHYEETTTRNEEGRYIVRLPLKSDAVLKLGLSKHMAVAQFKSLERKLEKQQHLATSYREFMSEYIELGHMQPCIGNITHSPEYYIPHHGIERAESTTTKYRVVFNASSKTSTGYSLNDLTYKGPNLQLDLQCLLLKWRQYQFAFTADIEKMYRQILVNKLDTPLQKVVWRESPVQHLQSFELLTVTYGSKPAPFLAMMTLKRLAKDEHDSFPEASRVLQEAFYMDDLVHGCHSLENGQQLIKDLTLLLKSGGFNLRKWATNKQELLTNISLNENKAAETFNFKTENKSKILGLGWSPTEDSFNFNFQISNPKKLTKRSLLSELSKIFDPLGWLAPVVVKLKLLFQKVWKTNTPWDKEVSADIQQEWHKILGDINNINNFTIPRWISSKEHDLIELHGFCDASIHAYACVVYARIKQQPHSVIVAAKTKLVPLKKQITLPRLELSGAYLLSKLVGKLKQAWSERNIEVYGWTDSKVVLGWLNGEPDKWRPFVANRVRHITITMPARQWRYVKTTENPADAASRGLYPSQLLNQQALWKEGPGWLSTFEPERSDIQIYTTDQEQKTNKQSNVVQYSKTTSIIDELLTKHSSLSKIIRILAYIQRAFTFTRNRQRPRYLTLQELRHAKLTIIKHVQTREYKTEINNLQKQTKVSSKSKLLELNPFVDNDNILRVGGRLRNATLSIEMKHPKIIPNNSRLAELIIDMAHKLTFHGGPRLTLATLRQEYWIPGGNNTVKKELRKCVTCRKYDNRRQHQLMGDLPAPRINPASPFYHTGVDYTGFVDVKKNKGRGGLTVKGYIVIFVCMVTKAVHLDIVSDLTSSAFLAALRRLSARRGAPRHLYSDNGTNFVGANNILREEWNQLQRIFSDSFLTEVTEMNIEWHFNAPAWPSAGGLWERTVRSVKYHLKRVVGQQKLTFEEYTTLLAQVEACLNSRPLCALTENVDDLDFLTPAHFLTGRAGVTVIETGEDARTRWHLTQKLLQDIWKRWKSEYLSQLTPRGKWQSPQQNIKLGELVVIHEDNLPSGKWALGRVVDVHPGGDNYVRVVTLKTLNGLIKRPITKLSVLPLHQEATNLITPDTNSTPKPRNNKRKYQNKLSGFITTALTFLYLISIITTGDCFKVHSLNKQQGLYFDKLANIQLVRDEWKIVAYYDLQPYWEGNSACQKYYKYLEKRCVVIRQQTHCDILMLQLGHSINELNHNNNVLLQHHVNRRTRQQRGLINGVGYLANTLFGVLDDRFAEQYAKDIALVRSNQKHLALLWKNQTSVVEAEFNLLKRTEETMQIQHKIINKHLTSLDKATTNLVEKINEAEIMTDFSMCTIAANNLLTQLRNIQNSLLDTITSIYNGNLNIHLIDSQQLQSELSIISGQLEKDLSLPIENLQTSMHNIYHLLKVKTKVTEQYLIFEIRIPLISRDHYDLYNIIPIPQQMGNYMGTIIPIEKHVAINLHKDSYLPMADRDWEHCVARDATSYLCQLKTPIYQFKSDRDLCVKGNYTQCKTVSSVCQNQWISLTAVNQYVNFCCNQCPVRILCKDQVRAQTLTGTNLIHLDEDCIVKTENYTIYAHKFQQSRLLLSAKVETFDIAPINNIINLTVPVIEHKHLDQTESGHLSFQNIENQISRLKEEPILLDGMSVHDVHHYTLIYITWGVALIAAGACLCRRLRCGRQAAPKPAPPAPLEMSVSQPPARRSSPPCETCETSFSAQVNTSQCSGRVQNEPHYVDKSTSPMFQKNIICAKL